MIKKCAKYQQYLTILCLLLLFPFHLQAHSLAGSGFADGLMHPLFGIDHLLAMIAVGIMGAGMGGNSILLIPAAFLISMIIGIFTPFVNIWPPVAEAGISGSLLFFGIIIAMKKNISWLWAVGGTAFFAFFHGHSHGEEFLLVSDAANYYAGLILMTALLHFSGVMAGVYGKKHLAFQKAIQYSGALICAFGVLILVPHLITIVNSVS